MSTGTGPLLRINVFDPLQIQLGERQALDEHFPRRKAKALFVYLFLNRGRWVSKYSLLADLWPEAEDADPGRVKHTVQVLRSSLEGPRPTDGWHVILERGGSYAFNTAAERYSDVEEYEGEVQAARGARASSNASLARGHYQRAIELHRGEFLSEFRYDDWAAGEITRQQDLYLEVLEEAANVESSGGNFRRAVELLGTATRRDSLRESSSVELMRNLWLLGRRSEAVREYQRLRESLVARLDAEPRPETINLYEHIRRAQPKAV